MAKNERFLTVDIGTTSIKLCEFEINEASQMVLTVFAYREYEEELSEETRMGVVEGVLRQMLMESNAHARKTLISLSGQSALIRFGKINCSEMHSRKQIRQLAEFEAKRNIPFELDKIGLDYQLIAGDQETNSIEVVSIVVKSEILEQFTRAVRNVGLSPILIDVAPVASYNAARANNLGEDNCALVVSIGGRSTNLMFVEGERFFARTIPIAGYSITQQIAKEFSIGLPEAEELKRQHGFVSLGGAYADPESETAANISKIIRNVMSRLHGEISRSINIYRVQQHGSTPSKIYLTGGSSILTYCDTFFSEKFNIPVEYFNPFMPVIISDSVDRSRLAEVAHMFSEVIGLACRYVLQCPIEINLLPHKVQRQQLLTNKKPFFVGTMLCLLVMAGIVWWGTGIAKEKMKEYSDEFSSVRKRYETPYNDITSAISEADSAREKIDNLNKLMIERSIWPLLYEEIFRAKPANVWIDSITPIFGEVQPIELTSVIETADSMGGDMGGMFGDMGGGMSDMSMGGGEDDMFGMGGGPSISKSKIGGFIIEAHSFAFAPSISRPDTAVAPEPQYPFALSESSSESDYESDSEGDETAGNKQDENDFSGEGIFIRNLQNSKLFSSDTTMTAMESRVKSPDFNNSSNFRVQVKLELELEAYPWEFGSTGNDMNAPGGRGNSRSRAGGAGLNF